MSTARVPSWETITDTHLSCCAPRAVCIVFLLVVCGRPVLQWLRMLGRETGTERATAPLSTRLVVPGGVLPVKPGWLYHCLLLWLAELPGRCVPELLFCSPLASAGLHALHHPGTAAVPVPARAGENAVHVTPGGDANGGARRNNLVIAHKKHTQDPGHDTHVQLRSRAFSCTAVRALQCTT